MSFQATNNQAFPFSSSNIPELLPGVVINSSIEQNLTEQNITSLSRSTLRIDDNNISRGGDSEDSDNSDDNHEMSEISYNHDVDTDFDESSKEDSDTELPHTMHNLQPGLFFIHRSPSTHTYKPLLVQFASLYNLYRFFQIERASEPLRYEADIAISEHRISQGDNMFLCRLVAIIEGDSEDEKFGRPRSNTSVAGEGNNGEGYTRIDCDYW